MFYAPTLLEEVSFCRVFYQSFTFLLFHIVGSFTSSRETSATSRLHFPLRMVFRYLQILGEKRCNKQIKTSLNKLVILCTSMFYWFAVQKWTCLHNVVQRTLKALENCTIKSLTLHQLKEPYSVLNGKDTFLRLPTIYGNHQFITFLRQCRNNLEYKSDSISDFSLKCTHTWQDSDSFHTLNCGM